MNKKLIVLFSLMVLLALPIITLAGELATDSCVNPVGSPDPAKWFGCIITRFINIVAWPIFGGVIVIMSIWAGLLLVTAHGDVPKTTTGKKAFIAVIIGIIIVVVGYSAYNIIKKVIGV